MRDPFYDKVPKFFDMTLKELYSVKHPTAWVEFERGQISEDALVSKFFKDGRDFDSEGMKHMMVSCTLNSITLYGELHIHNFITTLLTSRGRGMPNRVSHILRHT